MMKLVNLHHQFRFVFRTITTYSPFPKFNEMIFIDENKFKDPNIITSFERRNRPVKINFQDLRSLYLEYLENRKILKIFKKAERETTTELQKLNSISSTPNNNVAEQVELLNEKFSFISNLKETIHKRHVSLLNLVLCDYLTIPNVLHENTPNNSETIIHSRTFSKNEGNNHLTVGKNLNVLYYFNSSFYFLINEAALLEIGAIRFFSDTLIKNYKFQPFLNPDTCHNSIVDAISDEKMVDQFFKLEGDKFSLTGGSSFGSFCAFRVNRSVHKKYLPERNVSWGRNFFRRTDYENQDGLYSVFQRSTVQLFAVSKSKDQMTQEFNEILKALQFLYDELSTSYRICYQPAPLLSNGESLKASIQLYSSFMKKFVEVGYLSVYGDYVSKKLMMLCHDANRVQNFVYVIEGTVFNFPTYLANVLEQSHLKNDLLISDCIKPYMYC